MADEKKSLLLSLPAILTGIAAVLTAAGGLIYHNSAKHKKKPHKDQVEISQSANESAQNPATPPQSLPPVAQPANPGAQNPAASAPSQMPEGFSEQASYNGDCSNPPAGSACIEYKDNYRWLVNDELGRKRDEVGDWNGHKIVEAVGKRARYRHVLRTEFVETVAK